MGTRPHAALRPRRSSRIALTALLAVGLGFLVLTSPALQTTGLEAIPPGAPDLDNGRNLFFTGGCTSCHVSPGQPDPL